MFDMNCDVIALFSKYSFLRRPGVGNFAGIAKIRFKGCARYIFASLFFKSKRKHLSKQEKCFLFHFKSSFHSGENQILEFQMFRFHDIIKCRSIKHKYILLNNLGGKHSLSMKFGQFMSYSKVNNFIKKFCKNCDVKTSSRPFCVCKELSTISIGKRNF